MDATVEHVRAFNRGWTEVLGLLNQYLLASDCSLPESRILFELARHGTVDRQTLRKGLAMDASFLSRVLHGLEKRGLVESEPAPTDRRALVLRLTETGRATAADLDARSRQQIEKVLAPLTVDERRTVGEYLSVASRLLGPSHAHRPETRLREPVPGDLGWIAARNGALFHAEYGWNLDYEALVARVVADFRAGFQPERERAWIAEAGGARAGSVVCCASPTEPDTARLRLLFVEPWARGLGLGARLVDECVNFARRTGYRRMTLWTDSQLTAAHHIYETVGFRLVAEEEHHSFGHRLTGQDWEMDLT